MEIFESRPLSRIAGAVWTGLAKARLQALAWLAGIVFLALPAVAQQRAVDDVTVKPVKWVINSHFHGDHHMGGSVFKALGATFVAHKETARLMQQTYGKEMARRIAGFKSRGYDPDEVEVGGP